MRVGQGIAGPNSQHLHSGNQIPGQCLLNLFRGGFSTPIRTPEFGRAGCN